MVCSTLTHYCDQWIISWLLHKWRGYLLPTWASTLTSHACYDWILQSSSLRKWLVIKFQQPLLFIAMHYTEDTRHWRSNVGVRIAPPWLLITAVHQPGTSIPVISTRDFKSFISSQRSALTGMDDWKYLVAWCLLVDDDWIIHLKHQQVIFRAQVGNR